MKSFSETDYPTPFGLFDKDEDFRVDAERISVFVKLKLGDDTLSVELTNKTIWSCFEDSIVRFNSILLQNTSTSMMYLLDDNASIIEYKSLNQFAREWIRQYTLALCMVVLGFIRGKYAPDNANLMVKLNNDDLLDNGYKEQRRLERELQDCLAPVV